MNRLPHQERSLVLLKPDTLQRSLVGEVIARFERVGLKLSAMKMVMATEEQLFAHYNKDDAWFLRKGEGVVKDMEANNMKVEKEPIEYGKDIIRNLARYMMAAPGVAIVIEGNQAVAPEEAEREIKLWFKDEEIMNYATAQERIMYDVNFDSVKE